jgi:hypothetical protein
MGHLSVLGEWFALFLIEETGSKQIGGKIFDEIFILIAIQLTDHCDAGASNWRTSAGPRKWLASGKPKVKSFLKKRGDTPRYIASIKNVDWANE